MRINKELENLIKASLSDGELTEQEREVLRKKAEEKGFDLNEFEIILNSRLDDFRLQLAKDKKIIEEKEKEEKAIANNLHYVKKCPKCGSVTIGTETVCKDCEFPMEIIILQSYSDKLDKLLGNCNNVQFVINLEKLNIPKDKNDLFDFITYLQGNSGRRLGSIAESKYENKITEAIKQAKMFYSEDPLFLPFFKQLEEEKVQLEKEKEEKEKNEKRDSKILLKSILLTLVLCIIEWGFLDWWAIFIIILNGITLFAAYVIVNLLTDNKFEL